MTLARTTTIPSEFIRFDSHVTDADQFNNVRDFQVARENLNVLIARRLRHVLLCVRFRRTGYVNEGQYIYGYSSLRAGTLQQAAYFLGPWRVWLPPFCKMLTLRLRAASDTADGDILVYPAFGGNAPNTAYEIVVTGTALAEYELDVPVPSNYSGAGRWIDIRLFYTCESYGADLKGGGDYVVAYAGQESNGFGFHGYVASLTAAVSGSTTSLLYFTSPASTIEPQRVINTDTEVIAGTTYYRAHVDKPWNFPPVAGDTFNARALAAFIPHTLTVIPKAITDFGSVAGMT